MEVFAVDPDRPSYKGRVPVKAVADVVWYDDGHKRAFAGDVFKFDASDAEIYKDHPAVEFLDKSEA